MCYLLSAHKLKLCCYVLSGGASGLELRRWPNWLNPRRSTVERGGVTLTRMESKRKNTQRAHQTSRCLPHLHSFPLKHLLPFPIGLQMTSKMDRTPTVTITTTLAPLALDLWVQHSLPSIEVNTHTHTHTLSHFIVVTWALYYLCLPIEGAVVQISNSSFTQPFLFCIFMPTVYRGSF